MNAVDELVAWLRVQLDEDEQVARVVMSGPEWRIVAIPDRSGPAVTLEMGGAEDRVVLTGLADDDPLRWDEAAHIARWDPARVLAEVEARRRILDAWRAADADPHPGIPCENWPGQGAENRDPYDSCTHHLAAPPRTPDHVVRLLAQPYAGRAGWREEWRA